MDVVTAVIPAQGERIMTTSATEENVRIQAPSLLESPKAKKKARVGVRRTHVAPKKAKSGKKASQAKKASQNEKKGQSARDSSKTAQILDLLKRSGGATMKELIKVSGWQPHSVR